MFVAGSLTNAPQASSTLESVDPRMRLGVAAAYSVLVALTDRPAAVAVALGLSWILAGLARIGLACTLKRLVPLGSLLLVLGLVLPWTVAGVPLVQLGALSYSREGLLLAAVLAMKAAAIVLALAVLVGTLDPVTLGHGLHRLGVPDKLVHLLSFTLRYLDLLHREQLRLRAAMKIRGFRPALNRHTYRTYGQLIGMLLVRGLDRSERVLAAMRCRGFAGQFHRLDDMRLTWRDTAFALLTLPVLVLVAWMEWA